jgi:hypothetical protein
MAFSKRGRQRREQASGRSVGGLIGNVIHAVLRLAFGATVLAVVAAGLMYVRLSQGPIHLPYMAQIAVQAFNNDSARFKVGLGDVVLTVGSAGSPAGLQFVDFRVSGVGGEPLFAIPRLSAKFDQTDLLQGHLRPTQIVLIRPEARMLRTRDGQFRFGLGALPATNDIVGDEVAGEAAQFEAISNILDGLVGDAPLTPELSRLSEIIITNADLTYENEAIGRIWQTRRAELRVSRTEAGLRARVSIGLADGTETGAGVRVTAERRRGDDGASQLNVRFKDLRPEHLAEQLDQMQWLRLFDAPLNGKLSLKIQQDGRVEGLTGKISAQSGRILAIADQGQPFDSIDLSFAYEPGLERMQVSELVLASPALDTRLSGFVDLGRDASGAVTGVAAQFDVGELRATVPEVFAQPLHFDGGQIFARLDFEPMRIEVGEAFLRTDDLVLDVSGQARVGEDGWHAELRAGGRNLSVSQLIQHWPLVAAKNARAWVEKNIHAGAVDGLVAQMRFGAGEPQVSLDFTFSELGLNYLKEMTPIRGARGRASMTLNELRIWVESGEVVPVEGSPVQLDGSVVELLNLQGKPSLAEITIQAAGATSSILTLIDEQPLALVAKLGLDPAAVKGTAEVTAFVNFPLIQALKLDEVEVEADARLSDLQLPFRLPGDRVVDVAGQSVALKANKRALRLNGAVRIDGAPMVLDWNEYYGRGSNHRTIALNGPATPALLARFDLDIEYFVDGHAPMKLNLAQTGNPDFAFDLSADLGPALLKIADFGWQKPPSSAGTLEAVGSFGDGVRVSRFRLDAGDLKANGSVDFAAGGKLERARVERLQYRGQADIALAVDRVGEGPELALKVSGNRLDVAMFDDLPGIGVAGGAGNASGGADAATPLAVDYSLDELVVTRKVIARPATGIYRRDAARNAAAALDGKLAGKVPFSATYKKNHDEPAEVFLTAEDAGSLLAAADLFKGARGGQLRLELSLAPNEGADLVGVARMKDVRISGTGTFTEILDEGGVKDAAKAAEKGGLAFDKVKVTFEYHDGLLTLRDATAKGTLLAVTLEGTVDENTDAVDLVGAISPAYEITGWLNNIPVLGPIVTGGEGEGIFAMTFQIDGRLDDPSFSVNPLSFLAPGIFRKLFSGRSANVDEKFLENLKREID